MKKATWFIFSLIIVMSCLDDPDCFRLNSNLIGISFRVIGTGKSDTLRIYNIRTGNTDSLFYPGTQAVSLGLPLDFTTTETEFIFSTTRGPDTVKFKYNVSAQFVSEDCGSRFIVTDLDVVKHSFDSLRIVNRTPDNTVGGNIEIFRCPRTDTMAVAFRQLTLSGSTKSSRSMTLAVNGVTPDFTGQELYTDQTVGIAYLPVNLDLNKHAMTIDFDLKESGLKKLDLDYTLTEVQRYSRCGVQIFPSAMIIKDVAGEFAFDSVSFVRNDNDVPIRTVLDPFDPMINIYRCPDLDLAGIYFRNLTDTKDSLVQLQSVTVDFQTTNYAPTTDQAYVIIPLNKSAATTTVTFLFDNGQTRTLTINYTTTSITRFKRACADQNTLFTSLVIGGTSFPNTPEGEAGAAIIQEDLQSTPVKNIEIYL